jgi:hypothetical protein
MPNKDGTFTVEELSALRETRIIESSEIIFQLGDLFVAENVITKNRRVVNPSSIHSAIHESRRVLKG